MKFWNPGSRMKEMLSFSHTNTEAKEGYVTAYWIVDVDEQSFFEIPDVFEMPGVGGGTVEVPLKSVSDKALVQYRERGVVGIKPNPRVGKEEVEWDDDMNLAATPEEAKKKGNRLWRAFMTTKAQEWLAICEENKARGVPTKPATNLFKHALRVCHIDDPADTVETVTRVRQEASTTNALQAEVDALRDKLNQMIGAQAAQTAKG